MHKIGLAALFEVVVDGVSDFTVVVVEPGSMGRLSVVFVLPQRVRNMQRARSNLCGLNGNWLCAPNRFPAKRHAAEDS